MSKDTVSEDFLQDWKADQQVAKAKEVTCLGLTFPDENARREHFSQRLAEKLKDQAFRALEGFPQAEDETILRLSDPPYYCACPNPFLEEVIEHHGKPYDPAQPYYRPPFAVDVSEGKNHALYKAHGYHTKVPHLAILPCILHYTEPGDVVLDGFCGSGMTGVASHWCETCPPKERAEVEAKFKAEGLEKPRWGKRTCAVSDLSPAATFIAANYNTPFDNNRFKTKAQALLDRLYDETGWMYETQHSTGQVGRIEFVVWSQVYSCPECGSEINFYQEALDKETHKVLDTFNCPSCSVELTKRKLDRLNIAKWDRAINLEIKTPKWAPVLIRYSTGGETFEKEPDKIDLEKIAKIEALDLPKEVPKQIIPEMHMTHERARMDYSGITHVHHFFMARASQSLACAWRIAQSEADPRDRNMLLWFVEQAIWGMSVLARYCPTHYSQVNQYLNGVYYVASQHAECSPWYILEGKLKRLGQAFKKAKPPSAPNWISTSSAAALTLPDASVDYIYTDPPFGENIYYADLNYLVEAWHGLQTDANPEAIVDRFKKKEMNDYQDLMESCFGEYFRVLKPGRWMTMVFSNSRNSVWIAIQEALSRAGFIVADVRSLDKTQGSFRQVTSTAVKQDLVVTCYKANGGLEDRFGGLEDGTEAGAWDFVRTHLKHVPVVLSKDERVQSIQERTAYALYDRMTAFHVQRQRRVPLSAAEFRAGLDQHFAERDGMYFLPEQVAEYDRKRLQAKEVEQLHLLVADEASAISWLRQELRNRPRSIQDLFNDFKKQLTSSWPKHEQTPELKTLLDDNFLQYQGSGPVPAQIHAYLSTNYKDHRGQAKDNPALVARASGRWYVPDPKQQADVDQLRDKRLLKDFQRLIEEPGRKLKSFRLEAVRAGFKDAWQRQDYQTIVSVAERLPEAVLQEDDKLLMYFDQAQTRLGAD